MSIELGIGLALDAAASDELAALAREAEAGGLDLVVLSADPTADATAASLDPWTTATWLAGRTTRIQVGVAEEPAHGAGPADPEAPLPRVADKAALSRDLLAPSRLLPAGTRWSTTSPSPTAEQLLALAAAGQPVVVPVDSTDAVAHVVALAAEVRAAYADRPRRPLAVRARRRPGIAYDDLPNSLVDRAVEPGDADYRSVRSTYLRGGAPGWCCVRGPRPRSPTPSPSRAVTGTCRSASAAAATASAAARPTTAAW